MYPYIMTKPDTEELHTAYRRDTQLLFDVLSKTAVNAKGFQDLLQDLLTHSEFRMMKRRWYVACLVAKEKPMREIADLAGVGTDTVMRTIRRLREGNGALWRAVRMAYPLLDHRRRRRVGRPKKILPDARPTGSRFVFGSPDESTHDFF